MRLNPRNEIYYYKPKGEVTLIEDNLVKQIAHKALALIEQFTLEGYRTALISPYEINCTNSHL